MANKKISDLTAYTSPVSGNVVPINDGTPTTKKITVDNLFKILSSLFRIKDSSDITKQVAFDTSGITTGTTRTLTVPDVDLTLIGKDNTVTVTNKTLGSGTAITLGSDAEGDTYYRNAAGVLVRLARGTDNYIMKMNGNVPNWEGVTDRLSSDTTNTTFNNSSAENTLFTYSVPANTLGTNGGILLKGIVDFAVSAANINCTFRVKYGGTTLASFGTSGVTGTPTFTSTFSFDVLLQGAGATGSQESNCMYTQTGTTFSPVAGAILGASSIDSTASQNLIVTAQMDTASAAGTSAIRNYFIMKLV